MFRAGTKEWSLRPESDGTEPNSVIKEDNGDRIQKAMIMNTHHGKTVDFTVLYILYYMWRKFPMTER